MAIFHISSIKPGKATGLVRDVYQQLKDEMGDVVEPISMHALVPELLQHIYSILREVVIIEDTVPRKYKEAVGAAVSSSNDCPYCVDAHTIMIIGLSDKKMAKAVVKKDLSLLEDRETIKLIRWSFNTKAFDSLIVKDPPFSAKQAPEIIGTAVFFHYLNRMVTCFLGPTILPMNVSFLKEPMKKMAAMMFSKVLNTEREAGKVLNPQLLGDGDRNLQWTKTNKRVSHVFISYQRLIDGLAKDYLPQDVIEFIEDQIDVWDGREVKLNTRILDREVESVSPRYRPIARILYLVAFTPYRVRDYHFAEFRSLFMDSDMAILVAFSWASFKTATKIGYELGRRFKDESLLKKSDSIFYNAKV